MHQGFQLCQKIISEATSIMPMIDDSQSELLAVKSYAENAPEELSMAAHSGILRQSVIG